MNDARLEQFSDGFSAPFASGGTGELSGPYIPEAIECMRCGACIGGCPTFKVTQEENYSPRGRVRMIERLLKKNDVLSDDELAAFEACTQCRACETVCPSQMHYADLYRQAGEAMKVQPKQPLTIRLLLGLATTRRPTQRLLRRLLHIVQRSGLRLLLERLPLSSSNSWMQLIKLLPTTYASTSNVTHSPAEAPKREGGVTLFTGCVANIFDSQTHHAAIKLLARLGYDTHIPADQTCCGAIFAHNGELERAKACARKNLDAIKHGTSSTVVYNSSGCGAFLQEYSALLSDNAGSDESQHALPASDIMDFLLATGRLDELTFRPLEARVAVHEPCSQRNVLKNHDVIYSLLDRIPGLDIVSLANNNLCCGAGGTRVLTHPQIAEPLRDDKVKALEDSQAELLISTNLTCALHLSNGIRSAGKQIDVMHPVRLLAQQLA